MDRQAGMIKLSLVVASHNFANVPKMLSVCVENIFKEIHSHDSQEVRKLYLFYCSHVARSFGYTNYRPWIPEKKNGDEMLYGAITRLQCLWRVTCPTLPQLLLRRAHSHWDSNAKY